MRLSLVAFVLFVATPALAQLEINTGVVVNKNNAAGFPVHFAYDFHVEGSVYTKTQLGYKYLHRFNDYVGASITISSWELHQTLSYEILKKKKYILKPNFGLNYRFYHWKGKMHPPYNTLPQRAWVVGVRGGNFILNSFGGDYYNEYRVHNLGFSIQLQSQFRLTDRVWFHITPFVEPDYDKSQNTGGCYMGVILKPL
jgi:hypothetical protein